MRKTKVIEYHNDTKTPQIFYDFAMNPVTILPGETKKYFSKIIPEDKGFMTIAIPKGHRSAP
ncbi:hypothetical protein ES702_03807 [subsurface metagenome]